MKCGMVSDNTATSYHQFVIAEVKKLSLMPHNLEDNSRSAIILPGTVCAVRLSEMDITT